jgi:hypothetical protein
MAAQNDLKTTNLIVPMVYKFKNTKNMQILSKKSEDGYKN